MPVPKISPYKLPIGTVRMKNHGYYITAKNPKTTSTRIWKRASSSEAKCHDYLKRKISENVKESRKRKHKPKRSFKQSIAIAYSQTRRKYPSCHL